MSKQVKDLITKELSDRLKGLDALAVINPRGINANKNHQIRRRLREKGIRMMVVKNNLAKRAVGGGKLKGFDRLLDGPSAVVYGQTSIAVIARALMEEKKTDDTLELRGVFFDGELYPGEKGVEQVSKLPTREEAIALIAAAVASPGRRLAGAMISAARNISGCVKTIEEKAKEKEGGAAAAAAPAAG